MYPQIRNWTLRFGEQGEAGLEERRDRRKKNQVPRTELEQTQIKIEQHKLYLAQMERDLQKNWKKSRGGMAFRSKEWLGLQSDQGVPRDPIETAYALLHAARSAYHKWSSGKLSRRAEENERLTDKIGQLHEESPDKGYRRLNDDLHHDYGIHVNDKRVLRICRARGIRSTHRYTR